DLTNGDFEDGFADKGPWPDGVEKFLFCDELARTPDQIVEHREGFGSELYCLWAFPQALVCQVQAKGIEDYAFFVPLARPVRPVRPINIRVHPHQDSINVASIEGVVHVHE